MHKGNYSGLQKGLGRGTYRGLSSGLAKGLVRNEKSGIVKDAFLIVADSIGAGLVTHTASTLPLPKTAFEYDRTTKRILNFGEGVGVTGFSFNSKSPWAKFCIDYFNNTGRAACIINRAASSSTISPAVSVLVGNDWQTSGTNYNEAVLSAKDCLVKIKRNKLSGIFVILGINDVQGQSGTGAQTPAQVGTHLATLVTNLQNDFGTDVPIVFTQIGTTSSIKIDGRLTSIRNQIKQRCVNTTACNIGANMAAFIVGAFYESDEIHPNVTGNNHIGAMYARWMKNYIYSKWARSVISCHFDDIVPKYKSNIQTWFTTYATEYQSIDCMYMTKSSLSINTAWDWAFLCSPSINGGYTWVADSHVATNGTTAQLFRLGYDPLKTNVYATNTDYGFMVGVKLNNNASGTTAALIGSLVPSSTKFSIIRQLNTLGVQFACLSATSYTYTGENLITPGWWGVDRDGSGNIRFYKDGTVIQGPTADTVATPPANEQYLGAFNNNGTATSPIDAQFLGVIFYKPTTISSKTQFVTDLNTLQNY